MTYTKKYINQLSNLEIVWLLLNEDKIMRCCNIGYEKIGNCCDECPITLNNNFNCNQLNKIVDYTYSDDFNKYLKKFFKQIHRELK